MLIKRFLLSAVLFVLPLWAHADWAADRDASAGYVTVTTLATAVDEAVPFCVVYLSDMPADFWTAMDAASDTDGKTIRVSTSDGSTQLPCVPLGVNTGTDAGCLIFLDTGSSASTDVDFRIYNGNAALSMPTASGGMGEQAVFASYAGVYFPGVDGRDFTAGGRTLTTSHGTAASGYEGIVAATYNGSTQYDYYSGTQAVTNWNASGLTIEGLAYDTVNTEVDAIASLSRSTTSAQDQANLYFGGTSSGDPIRFVSNGNTGGAISTVTSTGFSTSTWVYATAVRSISAGGSLVYINGGSVGSGSTGNVAATVDQFSIGTYMGSATANYLAGRVAVAMLSDSARSADYVSTMQNNWAGTMYSAGSWTALDSGITAGSTGWVLLQTAATTSASGTLVDWTSVSNALVDDANYAQAALDGGGDTDSETLKLTDPAYGMTIPTGAPSYTVEFRIKRARSSGGGNEVDDLSVKFIDDTGSLVGDNVGALTTDWPTTAATRDYVATGLTLDGTEFTSAAGVAISATAVNAAGAVNARILAVWIKVSWTGDDPYTSTRGFFALED